MFWICQFQDLCPEETSRACDKNLINFVISASRKYNIENDSYIPNIFHNTSHFLSFLIAVSIQKSDLNMLLVLSKSVNPYGHA